MDGLSISDPLHIIWQLRKKQINSWNHTPLKYHLLSYDKVLKKTENKQRQHPEKRMALLRHVLKCLWAWSVWNDEVKVEGSHQKYKLLYIFLCMYENLVSLCYSVIDKVIPKGYFLSDLKKGGQNINPSIIVMNSKHFKFCTCDSIFFPVCQCRHWCEQNFDFYPVCFMLITELFFGGYPVPSCLNILSFLSEMGIIVCTPSLFIISSIHF